jgi:hypothetical protein
MPWLPGRADATDLAGQAEIRTAAGEAGLSSDWQHTVDALVVVGDTRLAPYSE